ncbi:MAG: hypothetical protein IPO63_14420 [Bacteroidetes bacterium]|nr:hypothetical protein [Bacteroidota bacterium]
MDGAYRDSASSHAISFDNYFVNYNQLLGTKTVTNNGRNADGKLSYSITVNGSIIWDPSIFWRWWYQYIYFNKN